MIGSRIALYKSEIEALGRAFDPMSVALARDVYVARDAADKAAALERNARQRQRIIDVARAPGQSGGSHVLAYAQSASGNEAAALYGSPDEIAHKLEALRAAGVHYILASFGGLSRDSLRRFAREVATLFN